MVAILSRPQWDNGNPRWVNSHQRKNISMHYDRKNGLAWNYYLNDLFNVVFLNLCIILCTNTSNASNDAYISPSLYPISVTAYWKAQMFKPPVTYISIVAADGLTLRRPRQNGRHFPDDISKWIFLNENVWILIHISLIFVPMGPISNIPD